MKLLVGFAIPDKEQLCSNSKVYIDWDKLLDIDTKPLMLLCYHMGLKGAMQIMVFNKKGCRQ